MVTSLRMASCTATTSNSATSSFVPVHSPYHTEVAEYTYPGLWLRSNPPQQSIKIRPNTSWSCHHGIARWKEACPCSPTGDWKANLRSAMDELGAMLDGLYVKELTSCLDDPWQLVYQFIHVLHGKTSVKGLVEAVCGMRPDEETTTRVDYLLRAINKQRMFTSWAGSSRFSTASSRETLT